MNINVMVFADTHGRALLCFLLAARWQRETGERIDLIVQAGDLGAFPDHDRLDRATSKWGERNPSELAFRADFTQRDPEVEALLAETTCPLVFVRGNHEDHQWLDLLEQRSPAEDASFAVDVYGRIHCLKTGHLASFEAPDARLTVLGIGRIGAHSERHDGLRARYLQPYERERLHRLGAASVDVLLTHDAAPGLLASTPASASSSEPLHRRDEGGLPEVGAALTRYQPAYAFFGHYGGPHLSWVLDARHGQTVVHKLADLNWDKADSAQRLRQGSMGILRWHDRDDSHFAAVDEPWLREHTAYHWRFV